MPSLEEVMKKEVWKVSDIEVVFGCKTGKAYKIMRKIKAVSDVLKISGCIHQRDYRNYIDKGENKNDKKNDD